jgi:hypothetical protein
MRGIFSCVMMASGMLIMSASSASVSPPPFNVIVNVANATPNMSAGDLRDILLGNLREWPNRRRITVVQRDPDSPTVALVFRSVLGMSVNQYQRYLLELEFRGRGTIPLKVMESDSAVCSFVFNAPGAIGFLPSAAEGTPACGQVKVLPIVGKR